MTDNDLFSLELNSNTESSSPSTESDNNLFIDNATNGGRNLIHRLDNDLSRNHFDIGVEDKKEFSEEIKHVSELLKQYQSLTIIPQSSKVIVLDTEVSLRAAFQALEENGMYICLTFIILTSPVIYINNQFNFLKLYIFTFFVILINQNLFLEIDSAPLWDSYKKDYIGVITIGDLIKELIIIVDDVVLFDNEGDIHRANILTEQNIPLILERLEDTTIKDIYHNNPKIISIDPSDSLYDVCWTLVRYNIHRVPVIDKAEQNLIIFSLSGSRIISFLMKIITDIPSLFQFTLENLKIGSFMNIKSIQNILTLGEVLRELTEYGYAALPIVDENGHLVETIYKSDISVSIL